MTIDYGIMGNSTFHLLELYCSCTWYGISHDSIGFFCDKRKKTHFETAENLKKLTLESQCKTQRKEIWYSFFFTKNWNVQDR